MGYHQAGFTEIVGIDIEPQPNYPFTFIQADALNPPVDLGVFDLVHASPPCQAYSTASRDHNGHPDLVAATRTLIGGATYVIENVSQAPLRRDILLCGSMFGAEYRRHRVFELHGFAALNPSCIHYRQPGRVLGITGHADGVRGQLNRWGRKYANLAEGNEAMGTPWMRRTSELVEAIPPAYTRFIGEQFLCQI